MENFVNTLVSFNKEIAVVILAALPVFELRGAIPLALAMDFSPAKLILTQLNVQYSSAHCSLLKAPPRNDWARIVRCSTRLSMNM